MAETGSVKVVKGLADAVARVTAPIARVTVSVARVTVSEARAVAVMEGGSETTET